MRIKFGLAAGNIEVVQKLIWFYIQCRPGGCRGCHDTPRFWQISHSYLNQSRLCPPNNTGTPGFSDLPMPLTYTYFLPNFENGLSNKKDALY